MKLFTFAGASVLNGVESYRFASSASRVSVLKANGHSDIRLWPLPEAMTKESATEWLQSTHDLHLTESAGERTVAVKTQSEVSADDYKPDVAAAEFVAMWFQQAETRVGEKFNNFVTAE